MVNKNRACMALLLCGIVSSLAINTLKHIDDSDGVAEKDAVFAPIAGRLPDRGDIGFIGENLTTGEKMAYQYTRSRAWHFT